MSKLDIYKSAWREMPADKLDNIHQQAINGQLNLPELQREALFEVWHERHECEMRGL